jgi:hypothetical protein
MAMRLRIEEYEIPEHTLTNISLIPGTPTVTFSGMAQEQQGLQIMNRLRRLEKKRTAIHYEAIDLMGIRLTGVCRIDNLRFEEVTTTPLLIIFSGELIHPDSS